jgi:hypothetical protein
MSGLIHRRQDHAWRCKTYDDGTGLIAGRPSQTAAALSSVRNPIASRVSRVPLPMCGVKNTLGSAANRWYGIQCRNPLASAVRRAADVCALVAEVPAS